MNVEEFSKETSVVPDTNDTFETKIIQYSNKYIRILLQDKNGACFLIALANILILKERITLIQNNYTASEIATLVLSIIVSVSIYYQNLWFSH